MYKYIFMSVYYKRSAVAEYFPCVCVHVKIFINTCMRVCVCNINL